VDSAVSQPIRIFGHGRDAQMVYWRNRLADAPVLELVGDRPRGPAVPRCTGEHTFLLSPRMRQLVHTVASAEGTTAFTVLLSAFTVLLARGSGQTDFIVGISGGGTPGALPLRTDVSGDPSFRALLSRVQEATGSAFAHAGMPLLGLLEDLDGIGPRPLFHAAFALDDRAAAQREAEPAGVELSLRLRDDGDDLRVSLRYAPERFDAATVERIGDHFRVLLDGALADAGQPVSALPLLADAERARIATFETEPPIEDDPRPFPARFAARVRQVPEATAILFGQQRITYAELDARAGRLANYLRGLGIGPESRVGVCLERTPGLIVALLAVGKAGAAYVPLEPHFPADRITSVLRDADAALLITSLERAASVVLPPACAVLTTDDVSVRARIDAESDASPEIGIHPESLAHVIYTSGSTGKPKGVMIRHGSVAALLAWMQRRFPIGAGERVLGSTSVCFDVHVAEVHHTLASGGALVLVENALSLAELPADLGIVQASMVPTAAQELLRLGALPGTIRRLNLGGEPVAPDLARDLYAAGVPEVHNLYGPTEDTTYSTHAHIPPDGRVTIGRQIAGSRAYVLDGGFQTVPVGVIGDLYLAGAGVSRGYLAGPGMTAERYLPDPRVPGERMYATGDRARWLPNGELECFGRGDVQVKVRGYRIEPGEIEAVLRGHPGVVNAVVAARGEESARRLVAWIIAEDGAAPTVTELAEWVRERLPEYMVPSAFVTVDAYPRTASGKVDRRALPEPVHTAAVAGVAPRTPEEEVLAGLWADVLGMDRVGVTDDFFDLGGHSLLATRLLSRIREVFGVELPVRAVFDAPTVAALAERIARAEGAAALPPIPRADRDAPLPLSFSQRQLWFLDRLQPGGAVYNIPVALRLRGVLDVAALERALSETVRRHEVLRTSFAERDGEPVQVIGPAAPVDLPVTQVAAAELDGALRTEWERPFDLAHGPLFRACLFRTAPDDHVLLATMHHAVGDGWSVGVLLRELSALYSAFRAGAPAPLPEPPVQFADYAAWQRAHLAGRAINPRIAWWRDRLAGAPDALDLPADRPRPSVPSHRGAGHSFAVPRATADALRALARREGATPFMALLAAYAVLLSRWSGQDDVVVGSPLAGRVRAETEGLIGFFANTLPLRADLSGDPSFRTLLARIREATLGAHAYQDIPFERLVDELRVERDPARTPLFQVVFLHQPADPAPEFAGLSATSVDLVSGTVKFDLALGMRDDTDGLRGTLQYAVDLFDAATIGRMGDHLRALLDAAVSDPDRPVASLPMLSDAERARLVTLETEPAAETDPQPFPVRFAAQVRRTPDATALRFGEERITYGDLDARANRVANHLRRQGIGPESRVGVCLERTPGLLVSLLGILKAGAAYVPLEPYFPADRIKSVLEDAGATLLLTRGEKAASLDLPPACAVLQIDDLSVRARIDAEPDGSPEIGIHPESLAHVIYTSGSTGKPKGVMIRHGSVAAFLAWMQRRFPIGAGERVLGSTSVCFDVHVAEVHHTLASGGALVLVENALSLAELPADLGIVQASMVPTAAQELLRLGALPGTIRRLNLGGEPVAPDLARDLYAAGVPEVHNLYGPTEDTTYSTHAHITPDGRVTIGRQIAGSRAYVLDGGFQTVPVGVIGDLYLAGAGVSRGYLARPGMTAERYLPDPRVPGERMYTTGDRARWLPNGELEYFGRSDFQVKVRGYRIEPGEIEAVLRGHPGVENAVVAARGEESARRLVAWIIAEDGAAPTATELAEWVRERLPEYMVPSAFVTVDAFPRTTSGKVDRKALPDPDFAGAGKAWVAPRTPAEQLLAGIFAGVLQVERIGADDDFFDLGGHSLLATRLVSRVREVFGVEMAVRSVFDHPTLARLADHVTRMDGGPLLPPVTRTERDRPLPLSFSQQRLWFLEQLEPGGSAYNVPVALRLRGALDVAALERSLGEIVRRHESLRTTFAAEGDEPVQVIAPAGPVVLPLDEVEEDALPAALLAEAERPFDLVRGPLFRARLFRIAPDEHALVLTTHHAVTDGWSVGVLFRELESVYGAFVEGRPSPLPEPVIQYADYAVWQRTHQDRALRAQVEYWRQALAGAPPVLELPTDRPRPPVQTHRGASYAFTLPPESAEGLKAMARREGATLYMALLAGWAALLGRYAGQDDVVVGSPVAGRTRAETEGLIGFFVNTLALRTRLDGDPTVRQLLARVREVTLAGFASQDVPFERVVEALGAPRDLGRSPVFQVMFVLQDGAPAPTLGSLEAIPLEVRTETAKFDLTLSVEDRPDGLGATLHYATDLFDAATVERMAGHLRALLEAMAADPARRVADVPLVTEPERAQLAGWNRTAVEHPASGIVQRFEAWAARTPDATAVACEERALSYARANAAANRLAHHLCALGVTTETRVGICLERGVDAVVALLAVLKAGGAYVPVDPTWPADRIGYALSDAGVSVVLTMAELAESATAGPADVVLLDRDAERIAAFPAGNPAPLTRPEQLAYVIYTSGSTGRPKGVMIEHRQLRNYVDGVLARLDLPQGASFGTVSTLAADLGNTSVFPALCTGGALHVVTHDRGADPDAFAERMRHAPVDVLKITPSHLGALLSAGSPGDVLPRRRLLLGGEASRTEWVESVRRIAPELRILNHYGPTETTVGVLTYRVEEVPRTVSGSLPLGRPLDNSRVYVLDPLGRELPVGVAGELCIGGAGVGRGYLGRPGMTAEKFVPDPFAPAPGARMYRTGDRARRLADGAIEFLGRVDDQVKIRGFRIEPGEVGAVLSRHPGLREAAVVARTVEGEARLAAYVVAAGAEAPSAAELRAWLRRDLPDAMVPSAFVVLDALPLTANGKVDRRALPEPEWAPDVAGADAAALRTPAEEMLAGVWAELLGAERVGPNDNFFELGGHSLLATRMLSGIRRVFGVEVPVRAVFEAPTVAGLAEKILQARAEGAPAAPPIVRVERDRPLPLSFAQQRLWFLDQLEPGSPFYNMSYALRLAGALDDRALERAIGALVERHESLRTVFAAADGEPVQRVTPAAPLALSIEPVADEEDARRVARDEALRPFDLSRGPLFRARLLRIAPEDHVLLVTVHHAVSDGWSLDVLFRELGAFYAAFAAGEDAPLPPPAVQYPDYAVWQRRWLHGTALDAQLAYWRDALAGAPPALELPTDRPRPPAQTFAGAVREFHLPPEVARGVRALARGEGATVFMTLLAAFNVVLSRWSGQQEVVVGSPMAGRTRPELEGVVGFFINTLPLRTDLSGDPSFRALVARVRAATMGAYAHQELPFERLVDDLKVERDPSRNPLFQVTFVLQNEPRVFEFGGVKVGPLEVESGTAKFDLTLAAQERSDGIACAWEYNTDLFDAATIERLTGHLARVIASAVADPARPVSAIDLLGEDEREVLRAFGVTAPEAADAPGLLARIAARAHTAPDAVAVASADGAEVTYGELDARANRLARHLRARGVGGETRVGICLERGADLVTAVLAVLRTGGAYVPIDPAYPPERRAYMLSDSGAAVLVTRAPLAAELAPGIVPLVRVDADAPAIARESAEPLAAADDPAAAAYVIYTSGSTGKPKGVEVTRRGLRNLVDWHVGAFGVAAGERTTLVAGVGFDASAWEIWPALAAGAALHVPADEVRADPAVLQRWMVERGITVTFLPTPLAEAVLPLAWPAEAPLRWLLTGGDALRVRPSRHLPFVLVNNYGPTECAVVATSGRVEAEGAGAPDIGRPIAGARIQVLDARLRPVPVGVPGELCVGGAGVARGYAGRPSLTAETFVPDPFGAEPGARMYRTGDRVRWRPDGRIEFLGRMDQQVKVRGYRIELGEIEAALLARGGVREAVVVLHQAPSGDRRLVGYVVGEDADAAGLRDALKAELPDYMVPAALVRLDALPLTPNGKLDRRALPAPELEADGYVAPRTPAEEVLAAIWAEVLGAPRVGVHDGFFDLGGHSLLATRVVSRVREAFRVELPLRALFEAPTVAELAARIAREEGGGVLPPIRRIGRETPPPLSFAQQRLWFLDQLEPGSPAYNVPAALRIRGPLDVAALERALGAMVARHETLRTAFVVDGAGEPVQAIFPAGAFRLAVEQLHGMADPEAEARRIAAGEAATPFDLAAGPLFRAKLLRLAQDDRVLLVTLHHAVSDGWSMGVFWRELRTLYAAFLRGEADPLAPLPVQYADYAVWQREHLSGPVLDAQLRWWRERLAGAPAALVLPTDRPRPPVQSYRGAAHSLLVPRALADGLRAVSRREGATLFMTLLAAFNVLLARWSGQTDLVVGSPVAGRARGELEGLIGFFVNSLPLRTDLSGDPAFRELLRRVRESTLEAHANQDVPFERLVEEIRADRDPARSPVFQVLFAFQEDGAPPALEGTEVARMPLGATTSKFDLTLGVREDDGELYATLYYAADLFDAPTIERMGGHLRTLLDAIVADPERRVTDLPLLTERERAEQAGWYAGPPVGGGYRSFPAQLAARVAETPDAVALLHQGARITYAQLDARANRIANHLRRLGVGPEVRVGLCLERTPELIAAASGILKAGGAYVPVEPHFPAERIAAVMRDSRAAVLITASTVADSVDLVPSTRVLRMDDAATRAALDAEPEVAPSIDIHPESLAVVIYTSGSTGKPKGVMIRHENVGLFVEWMREAFPLAPGEIVLGSTSIAFDVHMAELEFTLASGATLLLVENALALADLDRSIDIAQASMVPTAARELLSLGALPGRVRRLNTAGEALPADLAGALHAAGLPEIHNLYGPTEDTVYSTHHPMPRGVSRVLMGRPFDGRRAYVLDPRMNPLPVGVEGDIWLAGTGLVRGYLDRPGLTAEKFVPDPFGAAGERMYLSGDRGRWTVDGQLEFAGRADFQVKIRGFRIELGEIESVLRAHPAIADTVVVAHGTEAAKRLVAYVVPAEGQASAAAELAAWLKARLPDYMVPALFMTLDAFPRTSSGKLDRKALPAPEAATETRSHVAPSTRTEEVLASLWADVLRVERVSATAHFFDVGGHSLLATRLVARIREAFRVELPLRAMFEAPVLADLARRIDGTGAQALLPPVEPAPRDPPPPLAFAQQRLWFLHQLEPESTAYNVPAALRLRGVPDVAALERALSAIVARHEALRTTFSAVEGSDPVQVIHPAVPVRLAVEPVDGETEARRMAAAEAAAPFDLARGPLFRARLLRIAPEDHVLLLTLHHAVSDGWSMGVLFRELQALYGAFSRGDGPPPAAPPVQYADYAVWQRRHLSGPVLDAQLRYWQDRLAGAPAALALPLDHPRPATQSYRGATVPVAVAESTAARLRAVARAEGATLYMTLLAAFGVLLSRWSGQEDVVVGSPVSGRDRGELQELIGFFVNTLPLRTDLGGDPTFRELLARVRETVLQAHAHQDVPFERLVEALRVERDTGRPPLFQAMFLLQEGAAGPSLPGLDARVLEMETTTSKFDLTLGMQDGPDGLRGALQYAADLFEPATVRRMAGHLGMLLDAVAADPDRRVSEVPLLTDPERAEQAAWYAGPPLAGAAAAFPAQFAARAAEAPDAVAVLHDGARTTYAELEARANRIAHRLRRLGVGPEVPVGLCLPRTPELVAAALGILKAGGAYVPVEPHFPPERIAAVMRDARAAVAITVSAVADSVDLDPTTRVLRMDDAATRAAIDAESEVAPSIDLHPESLAVVIYTSGSTGKPKGVMIRHGSIGAFVAWMRDAFPLRRGEVVLGSTSFAFDVHMAELEFALASGATLLLVENALALADLDRGIEIAQASMVPTAARELLNLGTLPGRVRRLNLAGEALPRDLARALYAAGTPEVHDLYGPTEDTVYNSHFAVPADVGRMLLGRPFDGRRAYVLDRRMNPVPAGVEGDLWLAGCGLARGYLDRPGLTAEKFVPDPFGAPGARMYHSGDRARWTADGRLEFAGRADFQVKVRGFRIELGEIESVLRAHPAIADTVVLARGTEAAKRLVAYVVPRPGASAEAGELAAHLRVSLPEYMVPAAFVALDAFPRTASGKLDRKALPEPDAAAESDAATYVEPGTPTERALAGIWMEILGLPRVGARDDFFDLGGHSLLATRVMGRIRHDLGTELPLRTLFEAPTVARLAERVDAARRTAAPPAARIRAADRSAYRVRVPAGAGADPGPARATAPSVEETERKMS
jgi:amino acid adenylation domain-containing protein